MIKIKIKEDKIVKENINEIYLTDIIEVIKVENWILKLFIKKIEIDFLFIILTIEKYYIEYRNFIESVEI